MADENKVWSLEEIDALLEDSGVRRPDEQETPPPAVPRAEAVDPRPTHRSGVRHRIKSPSLVESDAETNAALSEEMSEKYRDRFFNRPAQNLEKTGEHTPLTPEEQPYERSGFVHRKSEFAGTGDFEPVPHLVPDSIAAGDEPADDATREREPVPVKTRETEVDSKTKVLRSFAKTDGSAHEDDVAEEDDGQLTFEGFDDEEPVERVDETEVEEKLKESRKEKIENFVVTTEREPTEADKDARLGSSEYLTVDDRFKVSYSLRKKKAAAMFATVVDGIGVAALAILSAVAVVGSAEGTLPALASLAVLAVCAAASFPTVANGFRGLFRLKPNRDSGVVIALVAAAVQCVVFAVSDETFRAGFPLFTAAAVFPLTLNSAAEWLENKRLLANFAALTSGKDLYAIGKVEPEETAFEIGRGLLLDDPAVLCTQKTEFPRRFLELSRVYYPSDDLNRKTVPVAVIAGAAVGALTLLTGNTAALCAFTATVCAAVSYFSYLADAVAVGRASGRLLRGGAVLTGWDSFRACATANAVAVDAADVFDPYGGNVFGIHIFTDMKADEAILDTASLAIASGGPLGNLFKRVVLGKTQLLFPVDTLAYEDKLGLSAWIFNRRVLVGSAELLRNHNVEIPDRQYVDRHLREGRYPLYLAVDGKAAAVFIVSYDIAKANRRDFRTIESNGLSLLVRSDDANITDELVANGLGVPQSGVKVLSAISGDVYREYRGKTSSSADAHLLHDGRSRSYLAAVSTALGLGSVKHITGLLQAGAAGIGVAITAVLAFTGGIAQISCLQFLLAQGLLTGIGLLAVRLTRK